MGTSEAEDDNDAPTGDEKPKKKGIPFAALAKPAVGVLVLAAIAASFVGGAVTAVGVPRLKEAFLEKKAPEHGEESEFAPGYVELPETAYELLGSEPQGYLLASITLKTPEPGTIERLTPEIRAVLQAYIRELSPTDLKGATGLYRLRQDCLHRARKIAGADLIEDLFITDIVVQ
ncbi:flagellar basal body-associated FliL family protein [Hyphococcus sp.]|jgi:flagellar basal body-associated protein FliL|uniref:flagellar basal body-associated FliL family protein n=1 Tax=Hyphococcus sp. TaxID=2038636 RepID=UPI003D150FFE